MPDTSEEHIFDPEDLHKLNDPERLSYLPPDYIWHRAGIGEVEVAVDVGAGTGFFAASFAGHADTLYACDISEKLVAWMEENVCPEHPAIEPVKMDKCSVPLQDGVGDVLYTINVHHELDEPVQMLKEARRLLQPGGTIFIVDWAKEEMEEGPPLRHRYAPEDMEEHLIEAGFTDIQTDDGLEKHTFVLAGK